MQDTSGWNFRHAHFHEEGRRTLYKAYGIKFVVIVQGRAGKFHLKNTVINIVAGLGLISFITMFCDFIILNYVSERKVLRPAEHHGRGYFWLLLLLLINSRAAMGNRFVL